MLLKSPSTASPSIFIPILLEMKLVQFLIYGDVVEVLTVSGSKAKHAFPAFNVPLNDKSEM